MPESLKEILDNGVDFIKEYDGFYYIAPTCKDEYDDTMWKVNVKTGEIIFMNYTSYILDNIDDKARTIDLNELLRKVS